MNCNAAYPAHPVLMLIRKTPERLVFSSKLKNHPFGIEIFSKHDFCQVIIYVSRYFCAIIF